MFKHGHNHDLAIDFLLCMFPFSLSLSPLYVYIYLCVCTILLQMDTAPALFAVSLTQVILGWLQIIGFVVHRLCCKAKAGGKYQAKVRLIDSLV